MSNTAPGVFQVGLCKIGGETIYGTASANMDYVATVGPADRSGLEQAVIVPETQRQDFYENARIVGARTGKLVTRHYLAGHDGTLLSAAPSHTVPSTAGATGFDQVLGAIASAVGQILSGGYNGAISMGASTTAQIDATAGHLSTFAAGQAVAWAKAAAGYEVGWLKSIASAASDVAVLLQTATAAPQGTKLWGSHTLYVAKGQPYLDGTPKSFTLEVYGEQSDDLVRCLGCAPIGVTFDFPHLGLGVIEITWGVGAWSEVGSGGAPTVPTTWTHPDPEELTGGLVQWGASLASAVPAAGLKFDLGLVRAPIKDYNAAQGIGGWYTTAIAPKVSYMVHRDYSEQITDFYAGTAHPFSLTFGSQPGKMFALTIPNAILTAFPGFAEDEGAIMSPIELMAANYTGDTGSAPADTPCRLAWL